MNITTFSSFRSRNYRLFFTGQSMSLIGTWMQRTAVSWVVYTITHSTFMLGLTVFASYFPSFLFSLLGGIAADRYDRFKILLITQVASMIQAILMAVLILTKHYEVWEILALSVVLAVINAFDVPARQPLVHELITDKEQLSNALALNSTMNNLAQLIGPALSGIVLQKYGAAVCFTINALSFVAVVTSLLMMNLPAYKPRTGKKKIVSELVEGFVYIKKNTVIGISTLMLALVCLLVLPYNTLLPVFAEVIFKGDAATFGYINSFIGLGAIAGAFFLASLRAGTDLKYVLLISTVMLGACLMLFSHTAYFPLAMIFAVLCGFGTMAQTTIGNTIIQLHLDAHMRGRVMSIVVMAITGTMPLGSLIIGALSQKIGAPNALLAQGMMGLIIAAIFSGFLRSDRLSKREAEKLRDGEDTVIV